MAAVSVVVPTHNRAALLGRLLAALERCEAPSGGLEVVVVDDGSTDHTEAVVRGSGLRARYERQENSGPASARNRGWRLATAPIVVFTDDDCVPDGRWLVELEAAFRDDGVAGAGGSVVALEPGLLATFVALERLVDHGLSVDGTVRYLVTANAAYRRDVLEAVGGFDETFPTAAGEDTDLSFRVRKHGGRLELAPGAVVAHDHRTSPKALLRTYRRHGHARELLAQRHPDLAIGAATRSMMTPTYWLQRVGYYRREGRVGWPVAAGFAALRFAGLCAYAAGIAHARRDRR